MNVTIAIDSFKGSLSSLEAGHAVEAGIKRAYPDASISVRPLADGGEGTVEALTLGGGGTLRTISVTGPLGTPVDCQYGIVENGPKDSEAKTDITENGPRDSEAETDITGNDPRDSKAETDITGNDPRDSEAETDITENGPTGGKTAIIEMSGAAGITLVPPEQRNPLKTTTYGVGEVILDAMKKGCRSFIIGIGGSATNDGGIGMLQALGYDLLDMEGNPVPFGAIGLSKLASISDCHVPAELSQCTFKIACDVTNPLCGPNGASAVYGPQKGASSDMIAAMDKWLKDFADLSRRLIPESDDSFPGCGAAGGLGFAFRTFLRAELKSGVQIVLDETRLRDFIKNSDLVVTGEGRLDGQTVMGKAPIGVAQIAKELGKPVLAFSGCVTPGATVCNDAGIDAFFPILRTVVTQEEAMEPETASENLSATAEQVFRLIRLVGRPPFAEFADFAGFTESRPQNSWRALDGNRPIR